MCLRIFLTAIYRLGGKTESEILRLTLSPLEPALKYQLIDAVEKKRQRRLRRLGRLMRLCNRSNGLWLSPAERHKWSRRAGWRHRLRRCAQR